jgi:dTDP-4-dehydrorhamnose reductase
MTGVVVFGASGMLGSMVVDVLERDGRWDVAGTVRTPGLVDACRERLPHVEWRQYEAGADDGSLSNALDGADWVVNAIGLTKPYVHDDDPFEVERALWGNAVFPFRLAEAAKVTGAQIIQIGTDCVFSGLSGRYVESSPHDALDVYGKTKSLGEVGVPNVHLMRCSIIGPEPSKPMFLLEWLRRQPAGAHVNGYTDHLWNGVTTHAFARLCVGILGGQADPPALQHVIPSGDVTKADLLVMLAKAFGREDVTVVPGTSPHSIDRTLRTEAPDANATLWSAAGYASPPTVEAMVQELAGFEPRLTSLKK